MGIAEMDTFHREILISSHLVVYGNAADAALCRQMSAEIENMWNEPQGHCSLMGKRYSVRFQISAEYKPAIEELEILSNVNPRNNYFRIEAFAYGNISFVDGLGCNTGYFKLENLYPGSTTAAHEYGHTIGLDHPKNLDIRGKGIPGIMYPRGTLVDPAYQYDPLKPAGVTGGTIHPMYRKVLPEDIAAIPLTKSMFANSTALLGNFTNVFHADHASSGLGNQLG